MSLSRKLIVAAAALAIAMFSLAACGGDDEESSDTGSVTTEESTSSTEADSGGTAPAGKGGTVDVAADASELAFTTGDLSTDAGEVTIAFDNPAEIGHDVRIEDAGGTEVGGTEVVTNESTTATVELAAGEYTYFCSIPGHRPAGMEGALTVK